MFGGKNKTILIAFSILSLVFASHNRTEIRLSFLYPLSGKTDITNTLPFGSAFTVALDAINNSSDLLPSTKLLFLWNDTRSSETEALKAMTEHFVQGVDAFIGPGEENDCITAARMAAAWNTPIVSYFCTQDTVSNKSLYPTFARTRPPNAQSSKSLLAVLKRFGWRVVAILYSVNPDSGEVTNWLRAKKDMRNLFIANGVQVSYEEVLPMEHEKNKTEVVLQEIKKKAKIVILFASTPYVQSFLVSAFKKGMTNGQYVYVINELSYDYLSFQSRDEWWEGMSGIDKDLAEKAFHSVLALVPRPYNMTKYARFERHVIEKLKDFPFHTEEQHIALYYSAYLYDAVYLYALAVNKTIAQGIDPKDGAAVATNLRETSYQSITGFEVRVDKNGDAEFNMTLFSLQKNEGGQNEMLEVGQLFINSNGSQTLELLKNKTLTWSRTGQTRVPADSPVCGFHHELCPPSKPTPQKDNRTTYLIITIVICSALGASVTILLVLLYRRRKFERDLTSLTWKVNYNEIKFHNTTWKNSMRTRSNSAAYSVSSFYGCSFRQRRSSQVGSYKATHVFIKKFERSHMEIPRNQLLELKQIYELHHVNLARFVGACVEPPNLYTLTEFCSRGSIQDIILDDNIKLDSIFIRSLVTDMVEGIAFLHSSEIKVHGNLKSSNCLVDGRWVLKITDFGLCSLKNVSRTVDTKELLWTAPEILRSGNKPTQKGDVYSFAIILQEMETRTPPFYEFCLDAEEIIDRVKATNNKNPFRPKVAPASKFDDWCMLMIECWAEDPDHRPSFREIKRIIFTLHGGKKENIVDKVIYLLEDYSAHLEDLVKERTEQWIEEKKKTEELLHSMLPKSVADQLIAGLPVKADYFEEVSIFFSDIVGFTCLCSTSSPLEIVNFLNDLYTLFDSVIDHYDVYKVETIGDAYMVASGLPIRNGHEHARHIADMALDLLHAQHKFKIRHKPKEKLKLRIGIHTGAVCAGVVGLRMPRYCLFGDAVNIASRMESSGEALKIHISRETKCYLDRFGEYDITERGSVFLKGKGHVITYWLNGRSPRATKMTCTSPMATTTKSVLKSVSGIEFDDLVTYPDIM